MNDYCQTNFLQPSGFKVTISKKKYPYMSFMAQSVMHPSMEVESTEVGYRRIGSVPFVGDKVNHGTLTIDVLLDENMQVYGEIYNWMQRMVETEHLLVVPFPSDGLSDYNDIRIEILSSANNTNRVFQYVNAFPTNLGDINFAATNDEAIITCPISFRFDYFEFI